MNDFMKRARAHAESLKPPLEEDFRSMLDFRRECMRISYVLDRWWENIEELFTQAHLRELAGLDTDGELCKSMTRAIWEVYRQFRPTAVVGYDHLATLLRHLVNRWIEHDDPRPVVVTTNYDIHLEGTLCRGHGSAKEPEGRIWPVWAGFADSQAPFLGLPYGLGFTGDKIRYGAPRNAVEFAKLHGSVNWFKEGESRFVVTTKSTLHHGAERFIGFSCQDPDHASAIIRPEGKRRPLIVPPLLGKVGDDPIITQHWHRAVHAFTCAREIVIMGYSFPQTDTFMTRLLAEGIRDNRLLERIIIVNPEKNDDWWKSVKATFASSWWRHSVERFQVDFFLAAEGIASNMIADAATGASQGSVDIAERLARFRRN
jgi:hypothetical protein